MANIYVRYPQSGGDGGDPTIGNPVIDANPNSVLIVDGTGNLSDVVLNDGQIVIGETGAAPVAGNITGAPNQISVTNGGGSIDLSLPQDINTISSPTFANLNLSPSGALDVSSAGTLAIGTTNASVINIGNSGATVNIQGTTFYQDVTNLNVTDKLITINKGGSAGSASNSGLELEEGGSITAYVETSADRNSWSVKAPATAGVITLTPGAGGFTLNQGSHNPVTLGTANGLSLATQQLSLALSSTSTTGALSDTDWNTFNGKQAAGNYITALTGDATASGPGSAALTLATVNPNVGTFNTVTVNAKGLVTAASNTSYEVPLTFSTGLTRSTNTITVNTSQNIAKLSNLTSNGFVKTSGGDGTLSVDTNTYLTANQTITLSGAVTGSGSTAISTTLASAIVGRPNMAVGGIALTSQPSTKTSTYSISTSDDTVRVDGSGGAFSVTLPTAVDVQGRRYKIIRVDQTLANQITVATTSAQTINGASSFMLSTQYEMVEVESDGSNWLITNRLIPGVIASYTPTYGGLGTVTSSEVFWWRQGRFLCIRGKFTSGTSTASIASISIPSGILSETGTYIPSITDAGKWVRQSGGGTTDKGGFILATAGVSDVYFGAVETFGSSSSANTITARNGNAILASGDVVTFDAFVPIAGWEG